MDKNEWISHKIGILIREGRPKDQAAAIAYSMWEKGNKNQEGGEYHLPMAQQGVLFNQQNPYLLSNVGVIPTQNVPNQEEDFGSGAYQPVDYSAAVGVGDYRPKIDSIQSFLKPQGTTYGTVEQQLQNNTPSAPIQNVPVSTPQYNDWVKYNILNPYGQGMDLNTSLAYTGQQFGQGNTGMGVAGAGLSALKGVRSFLSGYGSGKAQQNVEQQLRDRLYNNDENLYKEGGEIKAPKYEDVPYSYRQEGGKTLTNADLLTGNYITGEGQKNPTVEVEDGEHTKNSQTGQVQEVVGDKHIDGGEKVNLPDKSKVLSDYTKLGVNHAKTLGDMFDVKVKASDTFATVLDKYNNKIGIKKLEEEEKELLEKLEKNSKDSVDKTTQQINEDFLAQEISEVNKKKEGLNKLKSEAFEAIFQVQETVPKKGDGTQILDKSGNPIKQTGGTVEIDDNIKALATQYGVEPQKIIQILQEGKMKQEGGEQQGQPDPQQIVQAYAQLAGQDPNQVMQQLQQMQPEEQQAALQQMMQALQQGQGQPQMQGGGYTFSTRYPALTFPGYDVTGTSIVPTGQLTGVEETQSYVPGKGYGKQLQDVENTIKTHDWYFNTEEKKKAFREAVKKKGAQPEVGAFQKAYNEELAKRGKEAGLTEEQISNITKDIGFSGEGVKKVDELFGAYTSSRPLYGLKKTPEEVVAATKQPEINITEPIKRDVVKNVLYDKGLPYLIPPSAPIAPYLQQVDLSRLEGQKGSVENQLQASENARQALYASTEGLPPAQRAAILASSLATSGQQDVQGIAAQEIQDLQNKSRIEQYNASQADKEQLLNEQLKKQYEKEAFATLNVNEQNWRNYYDANQANQKAISDEIERRNIINLGLTNYQLTGSGGFEFVNRSPFQQQVVTDPRLKAMYDAMTPEQKMAYEKAYAAKSPLS